MNVNDFDIELEKITKNSMTIIGKGNYQDEVTLYYKSINFEKLAGWKKTNGAVGSLLNVNGTIYVGTLTGLDRGNLYRSDNSNGNFQKVVGWKETNIRLDNKLSLRLKVIISDNFFIFQNLF